MGVHDQPQKFCKVTVHRSDSFRPWEHTSMTRTTRSHSNAASRATVTYKPQVQSAAAPSKTELSRWTATGNAAIDGLDMPTRRRAHTTATAPTAPLVPLSSSARNDPLSRLTLRFDQDLTANADETEPASMAVRTDSFLRVDTDSADAVRQTFDEQARMFVPATPPIPSGLDVAFLPTADFTPELPSVFKRALDAEAEDDDMSPTALASPSMFAQSRIRFSSPTSKFAQSRIRFSSPGKTSSLYGDSSDYMDEMPTPIMSSSAGTPLEEHTAPLSKSDLHDEDIQQDEELAFDPSVSVFNASPAYEEIRLSEPRVQTPEPVKEVEIVRELPLKEEPELEEEDEEDEQLMDDDGELVSSFVEVEDEQDELDMEEGGFDVCDNFDAILGEPLPDRGSRWRFSLGPKKDAVRLKRGMSSPPRMVSQPPTRFARHMSEPAAYTPPHQTGTSIFPKPIVHAPEGTPLYHGQTLHLVFKSSEGITTQVSTSQRRSKRSVFSKLIECFSTENEPYAAPEDALRIIAHTSEGDIRGGDRISLARGDGSVLRIQKMSKKLSFSPKIDLKAKFVVCGVPEGTVVTDTTKFYLQSVYDRTKTIGFLKGRHTGTGCLVLYQYRTTDDQSEPIQFFKRADPPSFAQMHAVQQGHAPLTTSPLGAFM